MKLTATAKRLLKHMAWGAFAGLLASIVLCALMFAFFPSMPMFAAAIVSVMCMSLCMKIAKNASNYLSGSMRESPSIFKNRALTKSLENKHVTLNIVVRPPVTILITPPTPVAQEGVEEHLVPRGTFGKLASKF